MAQTELTAEQKEMWQNAVASVGDFGGAMISAVAKPLDAGLDVTGNALHTLNHNTPSLAGRPMTEILGIDNPKEIVTNAVDNFISGLAGAVVKETIGETPDDMVEKFAANPDLQNEDGQKLIQIMKDDPEFTQAFHTAMINEPTMAPGIAGLMNGNGQEGGTSLKTIVDGLSDEGNRSKFTQVLTAVGNSTANDDLNFDYTMDVADAANAVSQPGVKQEDYKKLQTLLARSNVKDPMLDFAADPMAAFEDFKKDPSAFFDQMANSLVNFEGPMGDMLRGMIQGMGQYIELLASPEIMEFYGHYIEPIVNDAAEKFGMNGETPEVATTTPTGPATPVQQQSIMWQNFKSEIDVSGLAGAETDVTTSLKNSLVSAFEPARMGVDIEQEEPEALAPYAPRPLDLGHARVSFGLNN